MKDQAENLRLKLRNKYEKKAKTIGFISGKGGVGKSNISSSMAVILSRKGYKVLLFDMDIGMGNVHLLLGGTASKTMADFMQKKHSLDDIIQTGEANVSYIAGGNGLTETAELDEEMIQRFLDGLESLQQTFDYIFFDMGAGASKAALRLLLATDETIVITTPEPTAIMDAYSMMKFMVLQERDSKFLLICNRAEHENEGRETFHKLQQAMKKFLAKEIFLLGILPEDNHVRKAVLKHRTVYDIYPQSAVSIQLKHVANRFVKGTHSEKAVTKTESFISKLRRLFKGR